MGFGLKTSTADNLLKHSSGGGGGTSDPSYVKVPDCTIVAESFTLNEETGLYEYTIQDKGIKATSIVNINISSDSVTTAIEAGLSNTVNSISGGVVITSKNKPSADMKCSYIIF